MQEKCIIIDTNLYEKDFTKDKNISEEKIMCAKLDQLQGKTPEQLLAEAHIATIPVDLAALLRHFKIPIIPKDFSKIENESPEMKQFIKENGRILGAVVVENDDISIFYTKRDFIANIMFTIAHEIAHCCLHTAEIQNGHIQYKNDCKITTDEKEIAANEFAIRLLIPEMQLHAEYTKLLVPLSDILAKKFRVPLNVMEKVLTTFNLPFYSPRQLIKWGVIK